jgi:glycosyltransferase involved in cell wall biosynthesis
MVLKKKNFHVLVDFMLKLPDYDLIIAGDKTGSYAGLLQKTIRQKNLSKRIILPGIISEEDKIYLYRNCEAFLFPSLIEGFGLPVIEAMRFGKPVFCSRRSSLPEVGGDYAFYWDSFEPEEMKEIFIKHLQIFNDNMDQLSKKNKAHSLKFKWDESIRQYLEVYDEVIQAKNKITEDELSVIPLQEKLLDKSGMASERPIKVLHLSSEKSWRGGEQQIAYLIDELNSLGVHNYIACRKGSNFEKYCMDKKWKHYSLNFKPPFDIVTAYQINRICKKHQIDILHMHTSYGHTLGMLSTLFGNKARLILSRRVDNPIRNSWFTSWKYNHPRIEKILTVSDAIREILNNKLKDRSKIITVHSGIDPSKFNHKSHVGYLRDRYHLDQDTLLIGNTSALSDHKDYPTYLNVARYIISKGVHAKFFIIGTGEMSEAIQKMITDQKLEKHVIMTGFLNNLPVVLPELDIFLMTSKTEGLGTSILDAFACEVPVVATRTGGIPEMVIHEKTGLLSPVKDYKDLGENILRIINDPNLRKELTANARKMVLENFSRDITASRTLRIYRNILFHDEKG